MLTRNLGKLLHGKTTSFQVYAASVLGMMLGFQPSASNAPGLIFVLIVLLGVLNANLFLAGMAALLGKILLVALLPVSFYLGRVLLDGPTQPLFGTLINAPGTALLGLEYYTATGGVLMGLLLGLALGYTLRLLIKGFRRKMASLESDSEKYAKWSGKKPVKVFAWLVFGGKGKKTYRELAEQAKIGNPIRPLGAAAAVLLIVLVGLIYFLFSDKLVTAVVVRGLERANGATVDLESAEVRLGEGRMTFQGLAMADPNALNTDVFRAATLEADISSNDLLRKRISLDQVQISGASTGAARTSPGVIVGKRPTPAEPEPPAENEKTLEDYIKQAQTWKDRLAQIREWLDRGSGPAQDEDEPTFDDWLKQQIAQRGYANVRADHLIQEAPTFLIRSLVAEGVVAEDLPGDQTLDIHASNLSTHPALVGEPPRIEVTSSADTLKLNLTLPVAATDRNAGHIDFALNKLPVDAVASELTFDGQQPIAGGTYDITLNGGFSPGDLQLPMTLTLHDTTLTIPGNKPTSVSELPLTLGLRGPMDAPRFAIDPNQLTNALVAAGANELANKAKSELGDAINDAIGDEIGEGVGKELGDKIGGGLQDLLGGKKKQENKE